MKKLFYVAFALFSLVACGQKKAVPQKVQNAFNQKFPNANKVKWGQENSATWEAEFKLTGKDMSANFNPNGDWLETETELTLKDLSNDVKKSISTTYKGYKYKEIDFSKTPTSAVYEVELKKGEKLIEITLNRFGKIISSKNIDKEEDND